MRLINAFFFVRQFAHKLLPGGQMSALEATFTSSVTARTVKGLKFEQIDSHDDGERRLRQAIGGSAKPAFIYGFKTFFFYFSYINQSGNNVAEIAFIAVFTFFFF